MECQQHRSAASTALSGNENNTLLLAALIGYVNDSTCAGCHAEIARAYQQVGMARSFFRPRLLLLRPRRAPRA
jgi:hypothetical protein